MNGALPFDLRSTPMLFDFSVYRCHPDTASDSSDVRCIGVMGCLICWGVISETIVVAKCAH